MITKRKKNKGFLNPGERQLEGEKKREGAGKKKSLSLSGRGHGD